MDLTVSCQVRPMRSVGMPLTYRPPNNLGMWASLQNREFSDIFSRSTSRALPKFRESAGSGCAWLETALFTAPAGNSPLS